MTIRVGGIRADLRLGLAELQKDVRNAAGILGGLEKQFKSFGKNMSTILKVGGAATAIAGLGLSLKKLSSEILELAEKGEVAGSIVEAFNQFGGAASSIEQARTATIGLVDSFELMQVANKGLLAGIPQFNEQFGQLADLAGRVANALGTDTKQELDRLVDALGKGAVSELRKFGFELEKTRDRSKTWAAVLEQLPDVLARVAPVTDSVANAQEALTNSWNEGLKIAGIAVNNNASLIESFREMDATIRAIDWSGVGEDLAKILAIFMEMASTALPYVVSGLENFARGLDLIFNKSAEAQLVNLQTQIERVGDALEGARIRDTKTDASQEIRELETELGKLTSQYDELLAKTKALATVQQSSAKIPVFTSTIDGITTANKEAAKLEKNLDQVRERWAEFINDTKTKQIEDAIKDAIEKNDPTLFAELQEALRKNVEEGFLAGWKDALQDPSLEPEVREQAKIQGEIAAEEAGEAMLDKQKEVAEEAGKFWEGMFRNLGETTFRDWANLFGEIGSALQSSGIFGGFDSSQDPFNQASKSDKAKDAHRKAGRAVAAFWTYGLSEIVIGILGQDTIDKFDLALPILEGLFGEDKQTSIRKAFDRWIEGLLEGFEFSLMNAQGEFEKFSGNFVTGSGDRFNDPNWAANFQKSPNFAVFAGLGEALEELLGITEDLGGQIGFLLSENLAGNIDNARLMVQLLGLSFEELEGKLVEAGIRGEMSWHEVEVALQGVAQAFKPGLAAVADVKGAFDSLIGSGGRGLGALKAVRDIAVEAMEAGGQTLEDLKRLLLSKGIDPGQVDAFMQALQQRGIQSLEALANASDRVTGGIVADLESASPEIADQWKDMTEQLKDVGDALEKVTGTQRIDLIWTSKFDKNTQDIVNTGIPGDIGLNIPAKEHAMGGIVNGRTFFSHSGGFGMMGEAGPEAILPLKRVNGRLGVMAETSGMSAATGVVINVDARGAAPGVSAEVRRAMADLEDRIVQRTVNEVVDSQRRGSFGGVFG